MELASASAETTAPGVRVSSRVDYQQADLSWVDVFNLLRDNFWIIVAVPLLIAGSIVAYTLMQDRTYTATAAFRPQRAGEPQGFSGVAAQMGMSLPSAGAETPAFYVRLLQSKGVLSAVVDSPFVGIGAESPALFETIVGIEEPNAERRRALALRTLQEMTGVELSRETGVVELSVTSQYPEFSVELLDRMIAQLNEFNLSQRQSQAAAERRFMEGRVGEVRADLRRTEERLQTFLQQNRHFMSSPELQFEHDRLERAIFQQHQLLLTLSQALEQARLDEVRDVPVVTLIDPPSAPVDPDSRGALLKGIIALIVGVLLASGLVLVREFFRGVSAVGRSAFPLVEGEAGPVVGR